MLQVFLLVEIVLLICLGISYTMYVYTRYIVSENYPVSYDTLKYTRILKRNRFWGLNTLSIICLLSIISICYGVSALGTFILKLGDVL